MQTSSQVVHHEGEQVRCSRCVGKVVITRKQFCGPLLGYAASIPRISSQEILVMRFVCSLRWHRYSWIVVGSTKQRAWRPPGSVFVKDIVLKDSLGRWITKSVFWRAPGGVGSTKQAVLVTPARATKPSNPQIDCRSGAANCLAEYSYYSDSIDQHSLDQIHCIQYTETTRVGGSGSRRIDKTSSFSDPCQGDAPLQPAD